MKHRIHWAEALVLVLLVLSILGFVGLALTTEAKPFPAPSKGLVEADTGFSARL